MIIDLPNKFFYSRNERSWAYIENGILYVEGNIYYEQLMYSLSYGLKGYEYCFYCKSKLTHEDRTLDHLYPRNWGGVSIPNNLVPSCSKCNQEKSNLTYEQYQILTKLSDKSERKCFKKRAIDENQKKMNSPSFILPKDWVVQIGISLLFTGRNFNLIKEKGNDSMDKYYEENHHYPKPIIVSSNNFVFKGLHILYHAKTHGIKEVPAVLLENAIKLNGSVQYKVIDLV